MNVVIHKRSRTNRTLPKTRPSQRNRWKTQYIKATKFLEEIYGQNHYLALSLIGSIIGYVQIWRVPDLAYQFGGVNFFIIYAFALVTVANAAAVMETSISQYTGKPAAASYNFIPIAKGLGFSTLVYTLIFVAYHVQLTCYPVYYFRLSATIPTPWMNCPNETSPFENKTKCSTGPSECVESDKTCLYPSAYFFRGVFTGYFTKRYYAIEAIGLSYNMLETHIIVWLLAFFAMYHSIKVTAILSSVIITIFYSILVLMTCLCMFHEGSINALKAFFTLRLEPFLDPKTWELAFAQSFLSMGVGLSLIGNMYFEHAPSMQTHKVITIASLKVIVTSLIATIFVYSSLGVVTTKYEVPFDGTKIGPGLFIIAYSEATELLDKSYGFSSFSFFILSFFSCTTISFIAKGAFLDLSVICPEKYEHNPLKLGVALIMIASFIGSPIILFGTGYFYSFDYLSQNWCILFIMSIRFLFLSIFYGIGRFCEDIKFRTSWYPNRFYRYIWLLGGVLIFFCFCNSLRPWLEAMETQMDTHPNRYSILWFSVGLGIGVLVMLPTLGFAIHASFQYYKMKKIGDCIKPNPEFRPFDPEERKKRNIFVTDRQVF